MVQSASSLTMLRGFLIRNRITITIVTLRLIAKIGVWPLHLWFIKIVNKIEIKNNSLILLITWQKVIPIGLLSNLIARGCKIRRILLILGLTLITPLREISKKGVKRIIALSSINNNSWIILASLRSIKRFTVFITIYSMTILVFLKYMEDNLKRKKRGAEFWESAILVANTSGVPPLTIFWAKTKVVTTTLNSGVTRILTLTIIVSATLMTYFYLWATLTEIIKVPQKNQTPKTNKVWAPLIVLIIRTVRILVWGL